MNRKELDEAILNAIAILKQKNRPLTPVNIQDVSDVKLRLYQIYSSKLKGQLQIRGTKANAEASQVTESVSEPIATPNVQVLADQRARTADIDFSYEMFGITLAIDLKGATPTSIDDTIKDLRFLFSKSVDRLEREKWNLL